MTYPLLATTGNRADLTTGSFDFGDQRTLSSFFGGATQTGSIWISLLYLGNPGNGFGGLDLMNVQEGGSQGIIGQTFGSTFFGLGVGGNSQSTVNSGTVGFLVLHLDYDNDVANFYVNPTAGLGAPVVVDNSTTSDQILGIGIAQPFVDRFGLQGGLDAGGHEFDEIRVGTTFAEVAPAPIPEPTSIVLLGLGALHMIVLRRRAARH